MYINSGERGIFMRVMLELHIANITETKKMLESLKAKPGISKLTLIEYIRTSQTDRQGKAKIQIEHDTTPMQIALWLEELDCRINKLGSKLIRATKL